jgi:IrrE N-terminal-like domain
MSLAFKTGNMVDRLALAHRRELGFLDNQIIDFMTIITKIKTRYPKFNYLPVPDVDWKNDTEAQWDSDRKLLSLPESTYCAANVGQQRAMMTVMHEVAHALLGHKGVLHRGPVGNKNERLSSRVKAMEREAKRYAAAFLMPDTPWLRSASAKEIAERYNVSIAAATIRKSELS